MPSDPTHIQSTPDGPLGGRDARDHAEDAGLTLVVGPSNAGKLGHVLDRWLELRHANPLIIAPTLPDVTDITSELLRRVGVVYGDRPVATMAGLIAAMRPPGGLGVLGGFRQGLLAQELLLGGLQGPMGGIARAPGAATALVELLDELGETGETPEVLIAALERWEGRGGADTARDLARLVAEYCSILSGWGVLDRHGALREARQAVAHWKRPLAFYGFTSFTRAQRALVLDLSGVVPVTVALVQDLSRSTRVVGLEEFGRLRDSAREIVALSRQEFGFASPRVAHLEKSFLVDGAQPWVEPTSASPEAQVVTSGALPLEGVRFFLSSGRRNELESVAAQVVSLLRSGVRADDMAVLVRRMGPWQRAVRAVFGSYDIPCAVDASEPFGATGLGHVLLRAVRGVAQDRADYMLDYLRSPYHPAHHSGVDHLEVQLHASGAYRGAGALELIDREMPGALSIAGEAAAEASGAPTSFRGTGLVDLAAAMLTAALRSSPPGSSRLQEDAAALNALQAALEEPLSSTGTAGAAAPAREERRPGAELESRLSLIAALPVPLGRGDESGVVRIMSVQRARARRFSVVFVLGLSDGEFPGVEERSSLLSPGDRRSLNDAFGARLLEAAPGSDEASLFALALSRPWQLLYLSARDAEDDGSEVSVSPYWSEARRLLPDLGIERHRRLDDLTHPLGDAPSLREHLRACAKARLAPREGDLAKKVESLPPWECRPVRLVEPAALARLAAREVFSATELETYMRCPFNWYAQKVVGLEAIEEALGGLHRGRIAHSVLADVYSALRGRGEKRLVPSALEWALAKAEEALDRQIAQMRGRWSEAELRLMGGEVLQRVRSLLEFDATSDSEALLYESEWSLPGGDVDLGGLRITGRVDRIDLLGPGGPAIVIDYKYGSDVPGPDLAKRGLLQVPLYMAALRSALPEIGVAGGAYFAMGAGRPGGIVLKDVADATGGWFSSTSKVEGDRLEAQIESALAEARKAAEGMRAGDIPGEPLHECPPYCDLGPLCRVPKRPVSWH